MNSAPSNGTTFFQVELRPIAYNLVRKGWTEDFVKSAITWYRRVMDLVREQPNREIAVTMTVDEVWHEHMLDSSAYRHDTANVFGSYLDHFPYAGLRGEEDQLRLNRIFADTNARLAQIYGPEAVKEYLSLGRNRDPSFCSDCSGITDRPVSCSDCGGNSDGFIYQDRPMVQFNV